MSLDIGNMSVDEPPILNDQGYSPDHPGEKQDLQPILEKDASHQLGNLDLEGITDISQQSRSEIGSDQTLTSDEPAAEAADSGCQDPDYGELLPDESGGVGMAPSVTRDVDFWSYLISCRLTTSKLRWSLFMGSKLQL